MKGKGREEGGNGNRRTRSISFFCQIIFWGANTERGGGICSVMPPANKRGKRVMEGKEEKGEDRCTCRNSRNRQAWHGGERIPKGGGEKEKGGKMYPCANDEQSFST